MGFVQVGNSFQFWSDNCSSVMLHRALGLEGGEKESL